MTLHGPNILYRLEIQGSAPHPLESLDTYPHRREYCHRGRIQQTSGKVAIDMAAPDISKSGDLSKLRRIASIWDIYRVSLAPLNVTSPLRNIARVQACSSVRNILIVEYHARGISWCKDLVPRSSGTDSLLKDSYIRVPKEPRLDVEFDRYVVEKHFMLG